MQGRLSVTEITTNVQCTYRCTRSHVWYRGETPQPETGRRTATRWLLIRSYCTLRATKVALDCLYCLLQRRRPNGAGAAVFRPKGLFAFSLLLSLLFRGGLKAVVYRGRRRKHDGRVRSSLYSKPKRARFAELTVLSPPDRKVSQGFESGLQRSLGLTHGRGRGTVSAVRVSSDIRLSGGWFGPRSVVAASYSGVLPRRVGITTSKGCLVHH